MTIVWVTRSGGGEGNESLWKLLLTIVVVSVVVSEWVMTSGGGGDAEACSVGSAGTTDMFFVGTIPGSSPRQGKRR